VIERIDLKTNSKWTLNADVETWILVIEGHARVGLTMVSAGDVIFAEADHTFIEVGAGRLSALIAYPGPDPSMPLLRESGLEMTNLIGESTRRSPNPKEIVEVRT
jgi:mannose-6-phosphate isomerase